MKLNLMRATLVVLIKANVDWCGWENSNILFLIKKKVGFILLLSNISDTLIPIIKSKIKSNIIYTDSYRNYNTIDMSDFKNFRINYSKDFMQKYNHIKGIEKFWLQDKRVFIKYASIDKQIIFLLKTKFGLIWHALIIS